MSQPSLPHALLPDLERVEQIIVERARTRSAIASVAERHLLGVTRPRAALTLLAANLGDYHAERTLHAAAAIELIHGATRLHSDLVDEAERRAGQATSSPRWGGNVTLMVGDYLLALAAAEMALTPDPRIIAIYSRCVMAICEAQLADLPHDLAADAAPALYLARAGGMTAALFEAAAEAGAVCGALAPDQIEALRRFGYDLGLAALVAAEAADFQGDPQRLDTGRSLRNGSLSLPLIFAAQAGDLRGAGVLANRATDEPAVARAIAAAQQLGAIQRAADEGHRLAAQALAHLAIFPPGPPRDALASFASTLVQQ
jgi:geranylgeranyl pyrophosphate synthase